MLIVAIKKGTLANCSANLPTSAAADRICCWWCPEWGSTSTPPCTPLFPFTSSLTDEIGLFSGSLFPTADTSLKECQINVTILMHSTMEQEVVRSWKQAASPGKGYIIPWSDHDDCSCHRTVFLFSIEPSTLELMSQTESNNQLFFAAVKNEKSPYFNHIFSRTSCVMFHLWVCILLNM